MRSSRKSPLPTVVAVGFGALFGAPVACAAQEPAPSGQARVRIETFASSRAYAVGRNAITLIAAVRNVGDVPLTEGAITGRLTCVTGLEYTEGDTFPRLPALAPNALMTFRWRVTPSTDTGPLVAAFSLEYPGAPPDVRVLGIQHLGSEPLEGVPSIQGAPVARVSADRAVLENGRVRARIEMTSSNLPGLWLTARGPGGWRKAGVSLPLAEVLSGEGGQEPWWEVFRSEEIRAVNGVGIASLVVTGGVGIRWRATMTFTLRANSSVVDYDIQLSPLRPMKLSGLRLGTLHAGEGGFGANVTEEVPYTVNGPNALAAVRAVDMTVGCAWSTQPLFRDWQMLPVTAVSGADYHTLGIEHRAPGPPVELQPGALVDYHCRMYALSPSASARDAFNILVPAQRTVAKPAPPAPRRVAGSSSSRRYSTSRRALIMKRESDRKKSSRVRSGRKSSRKSSVSAGGKRGKSGKALRSSRNSSRQSARSSRSGGGKNMRSNRVRSTSMKSRRSGRAAPTRRRR